MKKCIIKLIKLYQVTPGMFHNKCKYYPTCSTYAIQALEKYGLFKGTILTFKRLLKCNPFSKGGIDLLK